MKLNTILIILGCVLGLTNCKTHKLKKHEIVIGSQTEEKKDTTKIEVKAEPTAPKVYFDTEQIEFAQIKIKSKIEIKSDKLNQSIPATIHIRKDSIIWISVAMGLEAARASISPDSIFVLDRLNRKYYKSSFNEISRQFNFPITFEMLQSLIIGNLPIPVQEKDAFYLNTEYNSIQQGRNDIEIVNKFDPKSKKLYAIAAKDIKNNTDMSIDYKSFTTADSRLVPRIISVLIQNGNKEKDISIEMEHAKFDFLDRNIRFPFSIPKGYKYQEFDKN